ncbi:hypothetical protein ACET9H_10135 [Aeromonas media]|uniref:hypothetical protein n=1 Tax=Aeromonas media TaxID=651 RepID=UPI0038D04947
MKLPCGLSLRPYSGSFAGSLHHVVDHDGVVVRNATVLEVELAAALDELERATRSANRVQQEVSGHDIQSGTAS